MINIKKLRVFDFDDTLFHTTAKVLLKQGPGKFTYLTPAEYAVYDPKPGDEFDFSQFDNVINPKIIKPVAKRFYKIIQAGSKDRLTVILTARGPQANKHIKDIIHKIFKVDMPVITLGTGSPMAKADWIVDKVKNEGFNDIFFIDDSPKNVAAVYERVKDLPIKYKLVDLSTPIKQEGNNLPIKPLSLNEQINNVDFRKIKKAYDFFIKEMSLPKNRMKLSFSNLQDDTQANVVVSKKGKSYFYDVNIRTNNPMSTDEQIKHLAHEMVHIDQLESGIFNLEQHSWGGQVYPKPANEDEEKLLPWERDARVRAPEETLKFTRFLRDLGASKKIIKI